VHGQCIETCEHMSCILVDLYLVGWLRNDTSTQKGKFNRRIEVPEAMFPWYILIRSTKINITIKPIMLYLYIYIYIYYRYWGDNVFVVSL